MTPQEKAKQLIKKIYPNVQWKLGQEDCLPRAKRCALICVNEILKEEIKISYWEQVKQEIEKL